jgi:lysophospholipase L1-like esterase
MCVFGKRQFQQLSVALFLSFYPFHVFAQSCPEIRQIADLNCDGKLQITFVGDSIVTGFGDTENRNRGGYVLRLQQRYPDVTFKSVAANGLRTGGLIELLSNAFEKGTAPITLEILRESDVVILDMGRNDRLIPKPVKETYRALRLVGTKIRRGVRESSGFEPLIVTSVMMVPGRAQLAPFVRKLNSIILQGNSPEKPSDLRFDRVNNTFLSKDRLHPSSKGYEALSKVAESYLLTELPGETARLRGVKGSNAGLVSE